MARSWTRSRVAWWALCAVVVVSLGRAADTVTGAEHERKVRVAAVSFVPVKLGLDANLAKLESLVREAAAGKAELVVAPEGALDGYVINEVLARRMDVARLREAAVAIDDARIGRLRGLARELGICVVFGFSEKIGAEIFNTAVFVDAAGEIRGKYHKMLFEEGYHPSWSFNRLGARSRTFETPFGRCGILICNDRWNAALAKIPALDGAQFLVIPAFGSTGRSQDEAVLSRARETKLPVVEANVGVSLIVSAGETVAVRREREGVTFGEIAIPKAMERRESERDVAEREFLAWREGEMRRRFEAKRHRFTGDEPRTPAEGQR